MAQRSRTSRVSSPSNPSNITRPEIRSAAWCANVTGPCGHPLTAIPLEFATPLRGVEFRTSSSWVYKRELLVVALNDVPALQRHGSSVNAIARVKHILAGANLTFVERWSTTALAPLR